MIWFSGSIPDAINLAKQRNFVFVIVIIGEDEHSSNLMSSWEDDGVTETAQKCCVAIKVNAMSDTCMQFSQIYPVVCIPSSFFIGENGIPLEVIAGSVPAEELRIRINKVQQMYAQKNGTGMVSQERAASMMTSQTQPPMAIPSASSVPLIPPEDVKRPSAVEDLEPKEDTKAFYPGLSIVAAAYSQSAVNTTASEYSDPQSLCFLSEEDPDVQRHLQKTTLDDEKESRKPKEQQKTAKDMHNFKREQEDEKTKQILEERNREREVDKVARERVKQQIAMDRLDRAARFSKSLVQKPQQVTQQAKQAELEAIQGSAVKPRSTITRLQFRLPDGSSFTNQFSSQSKLHEAHQFVIQEVGDRYGNFSMATMFPRREFTSEDLNKTLMELELAPSSSIVLLPCGRPASIVPSTGGIWAVLSTLFSPFLSVWRFLSSFMFPTPPQETSRSSFPESHINPATCSDETKRESLSKPLTNRPKNFKKDGKICQLRAQEDSEDDNNTWNGNSTQQM
ncbi:UBX domain-containing protein 4 isoform X2 [Festucalex cinctus]